MRATTGIVLAGLLALGACSSDPGGFGPPPPRSSEPSPTDATADPTTASPTRTVVVSTPGYRYEPTIVVVRAGEAVVLELRNPDERAHALTVNELNVRMEAGPGERVRLPVQAPGTGSFVMYCSIPGHQQAGHRGRLEVR